MFEKEKDRQIPDTPYPDAYKMPSELEEHDLERLRYFMEQKTKEIVRGKIPGLGHVAPEDLSRLEEEYRTLNSKRQKLEDKLVTP